MGHYRPNKRDQNRLIENKKITDRLLPTKQFVTFILSKTDRPWSKMSFWAHFLGKHPSQLPLQELFPTRQSLIRCNHDGIMT